ncbi:MAG: hypothetical protein JO113_02545 [Candidatus Eremiobacteraeota bacterium]|nr:hypothetical protein [Candidatus Eremiobacteraeota bacterium]
MTPRVLAAVAALATLLGNSPGELRASVHATAAAYLKNIAAIAPIAGRDTTFDYYERLNDDVAMLDDQTLPSGYTTAQWAQMVRNIATLDVSLATQLLSRKFTPMASIRGLGETLVRSSKDGTMQPVAVYVPDGYEAGRPAPLVVFLHGRGQSETQLLSPPYVAELADSIGAIVVAPWGRGYFDFRPSGDDVYDALDAARSAFTIDKHQQFLAGYSMGGFAAFGVALTNPGEWTAVMSIAGALLNTDSSRVVAKLSRTPFYVLTGSADDTVPTQFPAATAAFLQSAGMRVSFYSQAGGTHRLITLLPILRQSWSDMLRGVTRAPPPGIGNVTLPSMIDMPNYRP